MLFSKEMVALPSRSIQSVKAFFEFIERFKLRVRLQEFVNHGAARKIKAVSGAKKRPSDGIISPVSHNFWSTTRK